MVAQAADREVRQPDDVRFAARFPHRDHQRDPLCQQATRNERDRLRGNPIEPLRVVDEAQERLLLSDLGQQGQHRQPDQEPVRRLALSQAERRFERSTLGARQTLVPIRERRAELMQPGVGQLHLGFDTGRARRSVSRRTSQQVFQ